MMLVEFKAPFALQVRVIRYKYFDLFLLTEMEEHGDIDEHKATLLGYPLCLSDLDYKIPDVYGGWDIAIAASQLEEFHLCLS